MDLRDYLHDENVIKLQGSDVEKALHKKGIIDRKIISRIIENKKVETLGDRITITL